MSRTEEDIESGVDITIMRNATLSTYPASYSEVCEVGADGKQQKTPPQGAALPPRLERRGLRAEELISGLDPDA